MIPPDWDSDERCRSATSGNEELRKAHAGHRDHRDCYLSTWKPPPLPWVKRTEVRPYARYFSKTGGRSWHLAIGIRLDSDTVQTKCNVGHGPGPFAWRSAPILNRGMVGPTDPAWLDHFCRRCISEWTRRIEKVTITTGVKMSKHAFKALADKIEKSEGVIEVELRMTSVENEPALIAELRHDDQRDGKWSERHLVVGDGVVKLA